MSQPRGNEQTIRYRLKVSLYVLMFSLGFIQGEISQSFADETSSTFPRTRSGQRLEQPRLRDDSQISRPVIASSIDQPASRHARPLSESPAVTFERIEGVGFKSKVTSTAASGTSSFPDIAVRPPKTLPESDRKLKAILESDPDDSLQTSEPLTVPREEVRRNEVVREEHQLPRDNFGVKTGPTITPLDKTQRSRGAKSWIRVEIQSVPAPLAASRPDEQTEQSTKNEIGPVSGEMSWRKSGVQQSIAYSESDVRSEMTRPVASNQAESEFPVEKVLELRKRLESAASLNPGQVIRPQQARRSKFEESPIKVDRPIETTDEVDVPRQNKAIKELRSSINVTQPTFKLRKRRPIVDQVRTEVVDEKLDSVRQPVVGRTSFIKWQPVTDQVPPQSLSHQSHERSKESQLDLRQSLTSVRSSAPEPQAESKSESDAAAPSRYVRSPVTYSEPNEFSDVAATKGSAERQESREMQPKETRFNGAMIDHAAAPSIDHELAMAKEFQKSADDEASNLMLAPLPPPGSENDDQQFDHPSDLFKRNWKPRTSRQVSSNPMYSANDKRSSTPAEESADGDNTSDQQSLDIAQSLASSDLSHGLATTIGVSPSTATSLLTLASIVTIFAGLWFVRSLVRAKNS